MKNVEFRKLRANEIEVRIQSVKTNGMMLLLYKNARVDMQLLDETVGVLGWMRDHKELKGNIYAGISIFDGSSWITKWDAGSESNTEAVKGEASDSFKRAGFNWGIGRELYTAPFTWVKIVGDEVKNGKCYTKFSVSSIEYYKDTIKSLVIIDGKGNIRFEYGNTNLDIGTRLERATKELMAVQAEFDKEKLFPKLVIECNNNEELAKVIFVKTLAVFNVSWTQLDLLIITEKTFIDKFNEQIAQYNKLKESGV